MDRLTLGLLPVVGVLLVANVWQRWPGAEPVVDAPVAPVAPVARVIERAPRPSGLRYA